MKRRSAQSAVTFKGNGWDGVDAHWRSMHKAIMSYEEAWPMLEAGTYEARSQAEKFAQAGRDLGADQSEEAFKGALRKLAKRKGGDV